MTSVKNIDLNRMDRNANENTYQLKKKFKETFLIKGLLIMSNAEAVTFSSYKKHKIHAYSIDTWFVSSHLWQIDNNFIQRIISSIQ